jgi:hypothetical protein
MSDDTQPKRSQASQLVDMANDGYELGVSDDGTPFGTVPDVPHVALPLRGGKFGLRAELARRYFDKHNTAPGSQALTDACTVLEGFAAQKNPRTLHLRVASHGGKVYIDTADRDDGVIVIADGVWQITDTAPVVFRRTELTAAMPDPAKPGDLSRLWVYVNIAAADRPVVLAWLVAALVQPDAPHPILGLLAEHGSAKSTTTRILVSLADPSIAPLQMPPRDLDAWVTAANGAWVVALDNMSEIRPQLSDALCRAVTGDALPKRKLYTDAGLAVLKFRRCAILNGIDLGGLAPDLADRLALADLTRITGNRRAEDELDRAWRTDRPVVLAGLLDLAAKVHQMLPTVTVPGGLPRMADFGKVLAAVDELNGTNGLLRYRERSSHLAADSIAADSFAAELASTKYHCDGETAAQILAGLTPDAKDWRRPRDWPRNARAATSRLTRHAPALRSQGWAIDHDGGRGRDKVTRWTITPPDKGRDFDPQHPHTHKPQFSADTSCGCRENETPADTHPTPAEDDSAGVDASVAGVGESGHPQKKQTLTSGNGRAGVAGVVSDTNLRTSPPADGNGRPPMCPGCGAYVLAHGHHRDDCTATAKR